MVWYNTNSIRIAMRPVFSRSAVAAMLACAVIPAACAFADPAAQRDILVNDVRSPELKTYRAMLAGLDAFDAGHALAPNAPEVRFRLRPRSSEPDADLTDLKLRIALDDDAIPVPLAPDHSFVLPRDARAAQQNGDLILNKKKGAYRWQPDIHSTGVPPDMRRMGDLRLECRVMVAVIKEELRFWERALVNSVLLTSDWCSVDKINIATYTPRRLKAAYVITDGERVKLPLAAFGAGFQGPIGDKAYSDDTLIALEYAEADMTAKVNDSEDASAMREKSH